MEEEGVSTFGRLHGVQCGIPVSYLYYGFSRSAVIEYSGGGTFGIFYPSIIQYALLCVTGFAHHSRCADNESNDLEGRFSSKLGSGFLCVARILFCEAIPLPCCLPIPSLPLSDTRIPVL